jgi:N-acetylmuramoyl-L-alanine amidase
MTGNMKLKLAFFTFIVFCATASAQGNSKFKVVLDPGHGGKDYGAIYHGFVEKNIALSVALKVGKILEKDPSVDVVYTRNTDVFIELTERPNIANRADANVFVSIHCNGEVKKTAYGTETFVIGTTKNASNLEVAKKENSVITLEKDYKVKYAGFNPNAPETIIGITIQQEAFISQSIDLASKMQDGFVSDLKRKSRGVKQAPFWVLHKTAMPSILIEMGFVSYQPEGAFLTSDEGQNDMAESIAKSILAYKKEYFVPGIGNNDYTPQVVTPATVKPKADVIDTPKPAVTAPVTASKSDVQYKVQIAASGKVLPLVPSNFNGLSNITKDDSTAVIKYYYGETPDREQAKVLLEQAKAKGYTSAFIVAFKDGKKNISRRTFSLIFTF